MLKIGEFAWLSQVTVETLRHYDRIGLLKPDHLDPFTGYRYYSLDQLARLNRILALRECFNSQVASIFSMRRELAIYTILSLDNMVCS